MWNLSFQAPVIIEAKVLARLPDTLRNSAPTAWKIHNRSGAEVDSFLEGPAFDRNGHLYMVDIAAGTILRLAPDLSWSRLAFTEGHPNGIAIDREGLLWVTD